MASLKSLIQPGIEYQGLSIPAEMRLDKPDRCSQLF
jgi:hypothetical protein